MKITEIQTGHIVTARSVGALQVLQNYVTTAKGELRNHEDTRKTQLHHHKVAPQITTEHTQHDEENVVILPYTLTPALIHVLDPFLILLEAKMCICMFQYTVLLIVTVC